jgi:hypothetical protein
MTENPHHGWHYQKRKLAIWAETANLRLSIETLSLPGLGESSVEPCSVMI